MPESRRGRVAYAVCLIAAWLFAGWGVYDQLPRAKKVIDEFGLRPDPLTAAAVRHARWVTPLAAVVVGVIGARGRPPWLARWSPLLVPVGIGAAGFGVKLFAVTEVLERVAR